MFHPFRMSPRAPANQCAHGIGSFSTKSLTVLASSSALTLTNTNGFSACFLTSSRSCGIIPRHGGHHVAQKSSTTTLPLWSASLTALPSRSCDSATVDGRPTNSLSVVSASVTSPGGTPLAVLAPVTASSRSFSASLVYAAVGSSFSWIAWARKYPAWSLTAGLVALARTSRISRSPSGRWARAWQTWPSGSLSAWLRRRSWTASAAPDGATYRVVHTHARASTAAGSFGWAV